VIHPSRVNLEVLPDPPPLSLKTPVCLELNQGRPSTFPRPSRFFLPDIPQPKVLLRCLRSFRLSRDPGGGVRSRSFIARAFSPFHPVPPFRISSGRVPEFACSYFVWRTVLSRFLLSFPGLCFFFFFFVFLFPSRQPLGRGPP